MKAEIEYDVKQYNDVVLVDDLVKVIPLKVNTDDRGNLFEIIRSDTLPDGLAPKQVYYVENHQANTIRGYHAHNIMFDWFLVPKGAALFVFFQTLKTGNGTVTQYQRVTVTDKNPCVIEVPPFVFHGWKSLTDDTCLISIASECYDKHKPDEVRVPYTALDDALGASPWDIKFK